MAQQVQVAADCTIVYMSGILYIVSTPIGNLDDITLRALHVLRDVDIIAAEDTRHSKKLLNHFGIKTPVTSYWGERERARSEKIIAFLKRNRDVALVSDAGTPGISDPGGVLIKRAIEEDIAVISVPGPSAIVAALTVSGLSAKSFVFLGFIPSKKHERKRFYRACSTEDKTIIVYESPHRLIESLEDLADVMPGRAVSVCHELTKMNESVHRGKIEDVLRKLGNEKIAGEYVIAISGHERQTMSHTEAMVEIQKLMKSGKGRKEAVKIVAKDYGFSSKKLYDSSLESDDL